MDPGTSRLRRRELNPILNQTAADQEKFPRLERQNSGLLLSMHICLLTLTRGASQTVVSWRVHPPFRPAPNMHIVVTIWHASSRKEISSQPQGSSTRGFSRTGWPYSRALGYFIATPGTGDIQSSPIPHISPNQEKSSTTQDELTAGERLCHMCRPEETGLNMPSLPVNLLREVKARSS